VCCVHLLGKVERLDSMSSDLWVRKKDKKKKLQVAEPR